eukprot:CAMPEP_0197296914 /NCGR_PEP_ID=MMETSP0890-20130614/39711_1 /TAXON_ID=44058 ORGANISM="Aureoumbra lagunensis, Strain CCMP1510" /NCGR_SAMPLE_ID=MMETSP0890 /ASSEMBLY_ACC=CAM_ASM_000533 /LENGTH=85 /DNA_ID=CAMNT_0042773749 /DNA_START=9 /DNA_END=263 /DNA_ORIENTATION=+
MTFASIISKATVSNCSSSPVIAVVTSKTCLFLGAIPSKPRAKFACWKTTSRDGAKTRTALVSSSVALKSRDVLKAGNIIANDLPE